MKGRLTLLVLLLTVCTSLAYGDRISSAGIMYEEDFRDAGVSEEAIAQAKSIIKETEKQYTIIGIKRKELSRLISKYLQAGGEENWPKIDATIDQMGELEAEFLRIRVKTQIEIQKYISVDDYERARKLSIKRLSERKQLN